MPNLIGEMLAELGHGQPEEEDDEISDDESVDPAAVEAAAGERAVEPTEGEPKRDFVIDLWPFAESPAFYKTEFSQLLAAQGDSHIVLLPRTAHPAAWLAARGLGCDVTVFTRDLPPHSLVHGKRLFREALIRQASKAQPRVNLSQESAASSFIRLAIVASGLPLLFSGLWACSCFCFLLHVC